MRLLYITNGVSRCGGLERVLATKTQFFIEEYGYDIDIITINEQSSERFFSFHNKIGFYNVQLTSRSKIRNYIHYIRKVSRLVNEISPDIVLVCDDGVKGLFIPSWLKTPAQLVYERHAAIDFNNGSRVLKKLMRNAAKKYDKFVVLTPACKKDWGNNKNIIVIPNPLVALPNQQSTLMSGRAICVGNLRQNKGYDLLIDALAELPKMKWHVDIYGGGEQKCLIEQAERQKVSLHQINFKGESQNIETEYLKADFLILPSRTEGFGMVLIEAMSYGLPCIAFDCPNGPRYIIEDGKNGFLAQPENSKSLADKIKKMLSLTMEQKVELSKNARKTSQIYTIENIGQQWLNLFKH